MALVRVLFEPVRSAEPPTISGTTGGDGRQGMLGRDAGGDLLRLRGQFRFAPRTVSASPSGRSPLILRELAALLQRQRGHALIPGLVRCLRALARHQPRISGSRTPDGSAELRARLDLVGAERRARARSPCRPWRARRSRWWCGRRSGLVGLLCSRKRVRDRLGIMPVDAACRPTGRLEALHLGRPSRPVRAAVDRDAVVVEQHDQPVQPEVTGQRDRLLADALPSGRRRRRAHRCGDRRLAELGGEVPLGNRRRPHCRGSWPSGLVVVSTPGVMKFSRMPWRQRAELAEALISSIVIAS